MSKEHKAKALKELIFTIIIVSTSRYEKIVKGEEVTDPSGEIALQLIEQFNFKVAEKLIIPDNPEAIRQSIINGLEKADAIVLIGGTGLGSKDYTYEVVKGMVEKEIPGFGELFRFLSYREIGSSAMVSRAYAGIINGKLVACIPGSPNAVKLALSKLLLPEVGHILYHVRKG